MTFATNIKKYPNGIDRVVYHFELHVGGLKVDLPGQFPLLCASLDVPTRLGTIITTNDFTLPNICETWRTASGFPQGGFPWNVCVFVWMCVFYVTHTHTHTHTCIHI
jgi:hypothetical protein